MGKLSGRLINAAHNNLSSIQGGVTDDNGHVIEALHLYKEDYDKLQDLLAYYADIMYMVR